MTTRRRWLGVFLGGWAGGAGRLGATGLATSVGPASAGTVVAGTTAPSATPAPPAASAFAPASVAAWPGRELRLLVAYPAGGVSDEIARRLAAGLSARIGVPVVVENRAGGGGSIAMGALARARPDGRTMCFSAVTPLTLQPLLQPVTYLPERDIAPISAVMATPVLVVGTPALPADSLVEAVALGRGMPGGLRWASTGVGTTGHLVCEAVRAASRAPIVHVPYKGGGLQLTDALAGHFELLSTNVAQQQLQYVREGRLTPLAVGAPRRLAVLPEVPTLAELGYPAANLTSLFGVFAPGATPPALRRRLNAALAEVLGEGDFRRHLLEASNVPQRGSADDFAAQVAAEARRHQALVPRDARPGRGG